MDPWVIFDADNTLWATENLYDEARRSLVSTLSARGIDASLVEEVQQAIDAQLYDSWGYSAERFPVSFDRTLLHFFPSSSHEERSRIRKLAEAVFVRPASAHSALEIVIDKLNTCYRLGILTAGEHWVQQRRLTQFAYAHHFNAIEIVRHKDTATFSDFANRHRVDRNVSWVIGDSLRSDIIPARAAGFKTILLAAPNWDRVEMAGLLLPTDICRADDLQDVLSIIPLSMK